MSSREIIEPSRVSHSCRTGDDFEKTTFSKRQPPAGEARKGETMGGSVLQHGREAPVPYAARRRQHDQGPAAARRHPGSLSCIPTPCCARPAGGPQLIALGRNVRPPGEPREALTP